MGGGTNAQDVQVAQDYALSNERIAADTNKSDQAIAWWQSWAMYQQAFQSANAQVQVATIAAETDDKALDVQAENNRFNYEIGLMNARAYMEQALAARDNAQANIMEAQADLNEVEYEGNEGGSGTSSTRALADWAAEYYDGTLT